MGEENAVFLCSYMLSISCEGDRTVRKVSIGFKGRIVPDISK
jgi:hypothetical protein